MRVATLLAPNVWLYYVTFLGSDPVNRLRDVVADDRNKNDRCGTRTSFAQSGHNWLRRWIGDKLPLYYTARDRLPALSCILTIPNKISAALALPHWLACGWGPTDRGTGRVVVGRMAPVSSSIDNSGLTNMTETQAARRRFRTCDIRHNLLIQIESV